MSRNKQRNKELSFTTVRGQLSLFLDENAPKALQQAIGELGFAPILLPAYPKLPPPVASHADLLLHDLGGKLLVYREYYEKHKQLFEGMEIVLTDHAAGDTYPMDIGMDALCLGNRLFCMPNDTCHEILAGRQIVPVKQGYAACACLKVTENAIVTSDIGIAKAAEQRGADVLRISAGNIDLPGYDCGFIGGTAFLHEDTLYFAGDLWTHPDGKSIADFCISHGVKTYSLVKGMKLRDLGFLKANTTNG